MWGYIYILDGIGPSLRVDMKFKPQFDNPVNGDDLRNIFLRVTQKLAQNVQVLLCNTRSKMVNYIKEDSP